MLICVYMATYETTTIILFPVILLVTGVAMELLLEARKHPTETSDKPIGASDLKGMFGYGAVAFVAMFATGAAINFIEPASVMQITGYDALLYTVLIAIAEEQFFRGFITDYLLATVSQPYLALGGAAAIFGVFHLAVYHTSVNSLLYVFVGGFILSWVAYKSRRLSPGIVAHVINNIWSVLG